MAVNIPKEAVFLSCNQERKLLVLLLKEQDGGEKRRVLEGRMESGTL